MLFFLFSFAASKCSTYSAWKLLADVEFLISNSFSSSKFISLSIQNYKKIEQNLHNVFGKETTLKSDITCKLVCSVTLETTQLILEAIKDRNHKGSFGFLVLGIDLQKTKLRYANI